MVSVILDNLAAGASEKEIMRSYSALSGEDIDAAMAFAAEPTRERFAPLPMEAVS